MRLTLCLLVPLALCTPALAGGGFTPGELVLYTPALNGSSSSAGGIARIDPVTGQVVHLLDLTGKTQLAMDSIAYDPFRDRLIFVGTVPTSNDPTKLWLIDSQGNMTDLGNVSGTMHNFAPASGGRIYFHHPQASSRFKYLDAANVFHTLMDSTGTQPFVPPTNVVKTMVYDPGTNALFTATQSNSTWNCGAAGPPITVHRIPLSLDGSRVEGTVDCTQLTVDPNGWSTPVGLTRGPDGKLLLVVDSNSNASQPRMTLINPVSLSVSTWASNDGLYSAATNAGTWSTQLHRAVILNTGSNVLQSYAQGDTGMGTIIQPSSPISSPGGTGEVATLIEIPPEPCTPLIGLYCTAKLTSSGCTPTISTAGNPSASAGSGFAISVNEVEPGNVGIFFYGQSGPSTMGFQGGFLCVQPPTWRTAPQNSGAGAACGGSYALDFNAYVAGGADPSLIGGSVVHGQFWFRDPPEPVSGTGLSGGVTFTLCP